MKQLSSSLYALVASLTLAANVFAQTPGIPDGKRVIIHEKNGTLNAQPMDFIRDMTIVTINDANVALRIESVDEASIRVSATPGTECKKFKTVYFPSSSQISEDQLEAYIEQNGVEQNATNNVIKYIDLKPETEYTISALAFDTYDLPCDITTITASTTANSEPAEMATPGSYFYADGTWSKELKTNKTPIGLIFSTEVSEVDRQAGFTHGYVVALKGLAGAPWTTEADEMESGTTISSANDADIKDLEGRTHTLHLMQKPDIHPAAVAVTNYGNAPQSTSGWFLPSTGQLLTVFRNLGNMSDDSFTRSTSGAPSWPSEDAVSAFSTLNSKFSKVGNDAYTPFGIYTWTSSEANVMSAYYFYCNPTTGIIIQPYYKNSQFEIRPVLAF